MKNNDNKEKWFGITDQLKGGYMRKLLVKIKGILGFCQSQDCWKRSKYQLNISVINEKRCLCEKHIQELTKVGKLTGITMHNGDEIKLN